MNRSSRMALRILLPTLIGLLALEVMLQIGAIAVACLYSPATKAPDAGATNLATQSTVLCVGDSFTFGMGASNQNSSYPSELQRRLNDQLDETWRTINHGRPGRNSHDVLTRLDHSLATIKPRYLCVLVGFNDIWSRPALFTPDQAAETASGQFVWRFRLRRLAMWIYGQITGTITTPPAAEPISTPTHQRDGRVTSPAEARLVAGDYEGALELLDHLATMPVYELPALAKRAFALAKLGRNKEFRIALNLIRERWRASGDEATGAIYLATLRLTGDHKELVKASVPFLDAFPNNAEARYRYAHAQYQIDHNDQAAIESITRALAADSGVSSGLRSEMLRIRVFHHFNLGDPKSAFRDLVMSCATITDKSLMSQSIHIAHISGMFTDEIRESVLREPQIDPGLADEIRAQWVRESTPLDGPMSRLKQHYAMMHKLAESRGAVMILLTHPYGGPAMLAAREYGRDAGIPIADCYATLGPLCERDGPSTYTAPYGHCNDAGYAIIAEVVADCLVKIEHRAK